MTTTTPHLDDDDARDDDDDVRARDARDAAAPPTNDGDAGRVHVRARDARRRRERAISRAERARGGARAIARRDARGADGSRGGDGGTFDGEKKISLVRRAIQGG